MKISVYGDLIHDVYIFGTSNRLSPEAPVPVIEYKNQEKRDGGAGNVVNNILSLCSNTDVSVNFCSKTTSYPTKYRIYADNHYVTRVDHEIKTVWTHNYMESDVTVISDYNKGSYDTLDLSKLTGKIIVDPKGSLRKYKGLWCLKPNLSEFSEFYTGNLEKDLPEARKELDVTHLIVTLGKDGVAYCTEDTVIFLESQAVEVFDVTGAGDTFTAVLAFYIAKGFSVLESIHIANKAAGIAVRHHGCYTIKPEDLNENIVFTNGCFDLLHPGHIKLLNECKKLGRVVVGLNSDQSVKRLKGNTRPILNQEQRKAMLEALGYDVVVFDEDTPLQLIKKIKPNIIVKGGDYREEDVVGYGLAKIVIVPFENEYSSSKIIERIKNDKT